MLVNKAPKPVAPDRTFKCLQTAFREHVRKKCFFLGIDRKGGEALARIKFKWPDIRVFPYTDGICIFQLLTLLICNWRCQFQNIQASKRII